MTSRWSILGVLFLARMTMAVQFQSVAALTPLVGETFGVGLGQIGLLIGLYLAPGVALAIPGGAIGGALGDRPAVLLGLAMMLAGGLMASAAADWSLVLGGRVVAGVGGVLLNVLMAKMVTDWFAGRELATAMGVYVNSWPVGIAVALLVLPSVAEWGGLAAAWNAVWAAVGLGLVAFALGYRAPPGLARPAAAPAPGPLPVGPVLLAGAVWALFNAALAMVFSFGPALLGQRGWALEAASGTTSVVLWLSAVSVPLGGVLADRTGRRDAVLAGGLAAFAVLLAAAALVPAAAVPWVFVALGLAAGLPAGPIMSLPSLVLQPATRALGMGLFFTVYYGGIMAAPTLGGLLAERREDVAAAFWLGVGLLVAALAAHGAFVQTCQRRAAQARI